MSGFDLKHRSRALTEGPDRAPARAFLRGIGYDEEALSKPLVAVANTWIETMPCNFHLRALAAKVKEGIREAGGTPMELNTIAISDGITMGTMGMRASLPSRELIADSIELVCNAHMFDAVIAIAGCDKTIPATVMALCRLNVPSLMLYGGSILPGHFHGETVTIQEVFEAVGALEAGRISEQELSELEAVASPGAGACGGQFTANTMAMAFEALRKVAVSVSPGEFADDLAPLLSDSAPVDGDAAAGRFRLRQAVWNWLAAAATDRPVAVVLDDLHCADAVTLELLGGSVGVLADRLAGYGRCIRVQQARILEPPQHDRHAAGLVQIGGHILAAGLQVAQQRRALADPVEVVDVQIDPHFVGDRQ